jgi:hypothetical protein
MRLTAKIIAAFVLKTIWEVGVVYSLPHEARISIKEGKSATGAGVDFFANRSRYIIGLDLREILPLGVEVSHSVSAIQNMEGVM